MNADGSYNPWVEWAPWHHARDEYGRDGYERDGFDKHGHRDLAMSVHNVQNGVWHIRAWPGPQTARLMQTMEFEGTLEDAQAVALVMARL